MCTDQVLGIVFVSGGGGRVAGPRTPRQAKHMPTKYVCRLFDMEFLDTDTGWLAAKIYRNYTIFGRSGVGNGLGILHARVERELRKKRERLAVT